MNNLTGSEKKYWDDYLSTLPEELRPSNRNIRAGFAGSQAITDQLLALYLGGKKTAGSGILEDYISAGDPPPKVGNFWILLDSKGNPVCILKTERVVTNKFRDVPASVAEAEGEGDLSLAYWKQVHEELYSPFLSDWGVTNIEDATVITEFFQIVHK